MIQFDVFLFKLKPQSLMVASQLLLVLLIISIPQSRRRWALHRDLFPPTSPWGSRTPDIGFNQPILMQVMGTTRHQASARQLPKSQHKRHQKKKTMELGTSQFQKDTYLTLWSQWHEGPCPTSSSFSPGSLTHLSRGSCRGLPASAIPVPYFTIFSPPRPKPEKKDEHYQI
jgi:hypothetical protein